MYHEVLKKGERWLWLMNIIVEGGYYGRSRHGLAFSYFDTVWLKNVATIDPAIDLRLHSTGGKKVAPVPVSKHHTKH